jgi:hypothetical protein
MTVAFLCLQAVVALYIMSYEIALPFKLVGFAGVYYSDAILKKAKIKLPAPLGSWYEEDDCMETPVY